MANQHTSDPPFNVKNSVPRGFLQEFARTYILYVRVVDNSFGNFISHFIYTSELQQIYGNCIAYVSLHRLARTFKNSLRSIYEKNSHLSNVIIRLRYTFLYNRRYVQTQMNFHYYNKKFETFLSRTSRILRHTLTKSCNYWLKQLNIKFNSYTLNVTSIYFIVLKIGLLPRYSFQSSGDLLETVKRDF